MPGLRSLIIAACLFVSSISVATIHDSSAIVATVSSPKNTRQLREGFWIGSMPTASDIRSMSARGIRAILSLAVTPRAVRREIEASGIVHYYIPIGSHFPRNADAVVDALSVFRADEIFVHCQHGSDRSGAFVAFLLVRRCGWSPQRALLAMTHPTRPNLRGLLSVLSAHGLDVTYDDMRHFGVYSGRSGMKATGASYRRLVHTMLLEVESGANRKVEGAREETCRGVHSDPHRPADD